MASRIEDYAMIGDCHTAALVARNGSIDWLCLPRFDSPACFAALLGKPEHGRWLIAPAGEAKCIRRQYRGDTLVLETDFETPDGVVSLIDAMPLREKELNLVRMVVGKKGKVAMRTEFILRFEYGSIVPWVRRHERGIRAVAGPDSVILQTDVPLHGKDFTTVADFTVAEGEEVPFVLTWHDSLAPPTSTPHPMRAIRATERWWQEWSHRCTYDGPWRDALMRSLITLKALTYLPTGGLVAAPTTSLPERLGGVRNWDYRYCWVRDATFTLYSLLMGGYTDEARAWREWLLRAVAGKPSQLNIVYGLAGERRLTEIELGWLPGYENSSPVRAGNDAHRQFQLDVFGEVMDALYLAQRTGLHADDDTWRLERGLLEYLESAWKEPDEGIWEFRGPPQHLTHSKVMAWVAVDRMVKTADMLRAKGPVLRWRRLRQQIHDEVCDRGFDAVENCFVQSYGSKEIDASLLMIPLVGFLPPGDPRVRGTIEAIERHLVKDGFVARYATRSGVDGLPAGEGAFLPCSFWLVDDLNLIGRRDDALRLFERLLGLRNDVGLLSEEYDPEHQRLVGNFPQAFSHVALINSVFNLARTPGPAEHRAR
jgi:GH15 family glucan-1,4-alpha-glucosidase